MRYDPKWKDGAYVDITILFNANMAARMATVVHCLREKEKCERYRQKR